MPNGVSAFGLGKLGSPMAEAMAARSVCVISLDAADAKDEAIQQGRPLVFEPILAETLTAAHGRLTATQSVEDAVCDTEITIIVLATSSEPNGGFSLRYVLRDCKAICRELRSKSEFHYVCLTSAVLPGTAGDPIWQRLEQASGKQVGQDFDPCYSPEFIALDSLIRDFLDSKFLLIGESDARSGALLESLSHQVCENSPAVVRLNFVNAEMAKLAANTYINTKISFANTLARICEQLSEANADVVTKAVSLECCTDGKYLNGVTGYGRPCFPRDNLALNYLERKPSSFSHLSTADSVRYVSLGTSSATLASYEAVSVGSK